MWIQVVSALIVDTSSWISYFSGKCIQENDLEFALKEGRVYLSPIVAAELLSAPLKPYEKKKLMSFLCELPLCVSSLEHWFRVGELRSRLSLKGFKISTPDAHIAQCCLDLDCHLLTEDKVFKNIADKVNLKVL